MCFHMFVCLVILRSVLSNYLMTNINTYERTDERVSVIVLMMLYIQYNYVICLHGTIKINPMRVNKSCSLSDCLCVYVLSISLNLN